MCSTHENGVPINFWQCKKPIGAGVLLKTCKGCDAATITADAGDWAKFRHEARVSYCVVVGDVSGSRPARNLYRSDLHSGAALDKLVYARVAEQDQRCTIVVAALMAYSLSL